MFYIILFPLLTFIILIVFTPIIYRKCKKKEELVVYYSNLESDYSESV